LKFISDDTKKYIKTHPRSVKYFCNWFLSLYDKEKFSPVNTEIPWITYPAIDYLNSIIRPNFTIFEYGSGGSTIYFSKKTKEIISVEHEILWANKVRQKLISKNLTNCQQIIVKPELMKKNIPYSTTSYTSDTFEQYRGYSFEKYVRTIDKYQNNYFDIVFIDGRARASCIYHAIDHIKKGGYLILDNSERELYLESMCLVDKKFTRKDFFGFGPTITNVWNTTIWKSE
jgi:hypothetical protein